ncbi:hypothetical protein K9M78_00900 [Candidatus Bipolaricaulota bacterium]|nr:hypothetical protein [Candidatus Bipolaricaulota bacterium]
MKRTKRPEDLPKCLQEYENLYSVYRTENKRGLIRLQEEQGFQWLAWTPNVRYLLYNPDKEILLKDVEGDIYVEENLNGETLEEEIQQYPKAEVSLGEKYDSRFARS